MYYLYSIGKSNLSSMLLSKNLFCKVCFLKLNYEEIVNITECKQKHVFLLTIVLINK